MKKLVKLISVNDGNCKVEQNGERLYIETYPRTEKIIAAFLSEGWTLMNRERIINPAQQKPRAYTFYLGGCDLLFVKDVDDDVQDEGDVILQDVLAEILEGDAEVPDDLEDDTEDLDDLDFDDAED